MGIYAIKPKFQQFLTPVKNLLVRYQVHPTAINLMGLILSVMGGLAFYLSSFNVWWLLYIPVMGFVRTACNALDGLVARELKVKNQDYGEVLNELIDRVSDSFIFGGLAVATYTNIYWGALLLVLILLNSYLSILSKAAGGARQYGGVLGKADRMIVLGVMATLILIVQNFSFADYFVIAMVMATVITIAQRFRATYQELYKA